jgi:dienelactone hydrolase
MIGPKEVSTDQIQVPGVVLFHTGAGPQDLFLHWKANILSHELGGAKVLIADMISDKSGWAWGSDRSKFNTAKDGLLPESGIHDVLQNRVQAAVSLLSREIDVDPSRIAALGWCFGGHAIQELVLSQSSCPLKAMATFHGVFHPILPKASSPHLTKPSSQCNVVIYTGQEDPFVTPQTVSATATALESSLGGTNQVKVVEFKQVKHGFSNPAQNFNPNPAFCYNQQAATQSWDQTIVMLKSSLSL